MGYGSYQLPDGRWAGYNIEAECDKEGCDEKIDRGLAYLCGQSPDGHRDPSEPGCGRYYCPDHQGPEDHDCPNPNGHDEDEDDEDLSLQERVSRVLFKAVMADDGAEILSLETWQGSCDWYAKVVADSGMLRTDAEQELLDAARALQDPDRDTIATWQRFATALIADQVARNP